MPVLLIASMLFSLILMSCSNQSSDVEPCPITVDSVEIVDTKEVGGKTYFLVYRVSGWQDKVEILELFDQRPEFDHCSKSNIEPVFGDSLEMTKKISRVFLNTQEGRLDITYEETKPLKNRKDSLRLETRRP